MREDRRISVEVGTTFGRKAVEHMKPIVAFPGVPDARTMRSRHPVPPPAPGWSSLKSRVDPPTKQGDCQGVSRHT